MITVMVVENKANHCLIARRRALSQIFFSKAKCLDNDHYSQYGDKTVVRYPRLRRRFLAEIYSSCINLFRYKYFARKNSKFLLSKI